MQEEFKNKSDSASAPEKPVPPSLAERVRMGLEKFSEGGGFEDKQLEELILFKAEFPEEFPNLDPQVVDILGAVFVFHDHQKQLEALRNLVADSDVFAEAVERGAARGALVLAEKENLAKAAAEQGGSDFAQGPHNDARVPA